MICSIIFDSHIQRHLRSSKWALNVWSFIGSYWHEIITPSKFLYAESSKSVFGWDMVLIHASTDLLNFDYVVANKILK